MQVNCKFAYAWYVASYAYLCSALVAMKRLQNVKEDASNITVDYVIVYVESDLKSSQDHQLLKTWVIEGGKLMSNFTSLKHYISKNSYYQACYQRFYTFLLTEYDRVISMDADGIAVKSLDHLFHAAFPPGISIAAPQGYWFENQGLTVGNKDSCPGIHILNCLIFASCRMTPK